MLCIISTWLIVVTFIVCICHQYQDSLFIYTNGQVNNIFSMWYSDNIYVKAAIQMCKIWANEEPGDNMLLGNMCLSQTWRHVRFVNSNSTQFHLVNSTSNRSIPIKTISIPVTFLQTLLAAQFHSKLINSVSKFSVPIPFLLTLFTYYFLPW